METRTTQNQPIKESLTALAVAQAYYQSTEYNHFPMDDSRRLIHYLVEWAKRVYPLESKWFAQVYAAVPTPVGRLMHSFFKTANYPGHIAIRKAYIAKSVDDEIAAGALQVLVIGGGFDVVATTKHKQYENIHFFEIDRGPHRQIKQEALKGLHEHLYPSDELRKLAQGIESFGKINANMHFIDADLGAENWQTQLTESGFDPKKKTICIAEGLTMYLTNQQIHLLLTSMRELLTDDSSLILSFLEAAKKSFTEELGTQMLAQTNENYKMRLSPTEVPKFMFENGFSIVEALPCGEIQKLLGSTTIDLTTIDNLKENYFKLKINAPGAVLQENINYRVGSLSM